MKKLFTLMLMGLCFSSNAKEFVSSKLDKDFYFVDSEAERIDIMVENTSDNLAGIEIKLYGSEIVDSKVVYKLEHEITDYDIYPNKFILPPNKKQKVTVINNFYGDEEQVYKIRSLPKSAKTLLKSNPHLLHTMSNSERMNYEESLLTSEITVNIGSGSLIIKQPQSKVDTDNIDVIIDSGYLKVKNNSKYIIQLNKVYINGVDRTNNITLLGGTEIRKKIINEYVINEFKYTDQFGNKFNLECDKSSCKLRK